MTAGPGNPMAGLAGRGRLRASHADRNHVIGMLKAAYVQGRLTKDEFDERMSATLTARTFADLAGLTADLPAGLTDVPPAPPPRPPSPAPVAKILLSAAAGLLAPAILATASLTGNAQLYALFILPTMITFVAWMVAGAVALDSWHGRHSGPPPPPGGGPGRPGGGRPGGGSGRDVQCQGGPPARSASPWRPPGSFPG